MGPANPERAKEEDKKELTKEEALQEALKKQERKERKEAQERKEKEALAAKPVPVAVPAPATATREPFDHADIVEPVEFNESDIVFTAELEVPRKGWPVLPEPSEILYLKEVAQSGYKAFVKGPEGENVAFVDSSGLISALDGYYVGVKRGVLEVGKY